MTEEEAHKLVMGLLLQNARGDGEAILSLAESIAPEDLGMMFQGALSVAYAAHVALAELEDRDFLEFMQEMAVATAAVPEPVVPEMPNGQD